MENKTAEELVNHFWENRHEEDRAYSKVLIVECMKSFASQQCAELQEINRVYKNCQEKDGETIKSLQSENESLKKRVEELTDALKLAYPYVHDKNVAELITKGFNYPPKNPRT